MKNPKQHTPPSWGQRFLEYIFDPEVIEEVLGDLHEAFDYRLNQSGRFSAYLMYVLDAIRFIHPYFLKRPQFHLMINSTYFKVAWRYMMQNRSYTIINLLGLAIGIACTALIALYTLDELSYDEFHSNSDRIIRVAENQIDQEGKVVEMATSKGALTGVLQTVFPDWEAVSRILPTSLMVGNGPEKRFQEDHFFYVDSSFLEIFDFPLKYGDKLSALDAPFSLLITESTAYKYFGDANPINEILTVRNEEGIYSFTVKGVLKDLPENSHLQFDFLASYSSLRTLMPWVNNWHYPPLYTYALLPNEVNRKGISKQLAEIPARHLPKDLAESRQFIMQSLTDIHLHSQREGEISSNGDINYIYLFWAIGTFILLIACINFMNLATAYSIKRSKEVGMRKVMGARRGQLITQFIGESMIMTLIALILAGGIIYLILPYFNEFTAKSMEFSLFVQEGILWILLAFILFIGLLAGSYPAFYLSGFLAAHVLKANPGNNRGASIGIRKGLVIFQFLVSSALIIGTLIIYQQLNYLRNKHLGFEKEQLVLVNLRDEADQIHIERLRAKLIQHPNILSASAASGIPARGGYYNNIIKPKNGSQDSLTIATNFINDHAYVKTMGMEIISGRDFSINFATDSSSSFLLNEAAVERLGWANPLEQELSLIYDARGEVVKKGRIIGVVKDFHFNTLHKSVEPVIMHLSGATYFTNSLLVRVKATNMQTSLAFMEEEWDAFNPTRPFEYEFMDEIFDTLYREDESLGKVAAGFSLLAIFIACLGLFGLAAFTAEQRRYEIGIRKILGASVPNIVALMSWDFLKLVLIAFVISLPASYFFMQEWLANFAYQADPGWKIFCLSGTICLLIAFLTVSSQAYKAAQINPVEALRNE